MPAFHIKAAWGLRRGLDMPPRGDGDGDGDAFATAMRAVDAGGSMTLLPMTRRALGAAA